MAADPETGSLPQAPHWGNQASQWTERAWASLPDVTALCGRKLRRAQQIYLIAVAVFVALFFVFWSPTQELWTTVSSGRQNGLKTEANINQELSVNPVELAAQLAANDTLGFERAWYLNLPYRTDRNDAMTLISKFSNLQFERQAAVDGTTVHDKARPVGSGNLRPAEIGCWRSHADLWLKMINEDVQTALIMEDDIDWDVNVRQVFSTLSRQMTSSSNVNATVPENFNPYGDDWELLFVGECFEDFGNKDQEPFRRPYVDSHGPSLDEMDDHFRWLVSSQNLDFTSQNWRVLAPSWGPVCTMGYAVTNAGARKLLQRLGGYDDLGMPVDLAMLNMVHHNQIKSFSVVPPPLARFYVEGPKGSDIQTTSDELTGNLQGRSKNLHTSVRQTMVETEIN